MGWKTRLGEVLLWSVLSAAFIGPGTVTTAASAGAGYGASLLWALLFSTLACILLQEAAARIPLATGLNLGEAISQRYAQSPLDLPVRGLLTAAIMVGGIAYQAGNILGGVAGLNMLIGAETQGLTLGLGLIAGSLLWLGSPVLLARLLGLAVAGMALAFVTVAFSVDLGAGEILGGLLMPSIPKNSGWLVLGLVGTTIVPYNLFLGSGLSRKDTPLGTMRSGLIIAIGLGGLISAAVLIAGIRVVGQFSFAGLGAALEAQLGAWGLYLFGFGLFAAGLSSAITAPLATAITAASFFGRKNPKWKPDGFYYRMTWGLVLASGIGFGVAGFRPVPIIILAQALNGLILPLVALFLLGAINDARVMPSEYRNNRAGNILMLLVIGISILLGLSQLWRSGSAALGFSPGKEGLETIWLGVISLALTALAGWRILSSR